MDCENLLGGIGTKGRVPIKIKKQLMSTDDFIHYILVPELATCKQASLKLYDNGFPMLNHIDPMDKVFILYCV